MTTETKWTGLKAINCGNFFANRQNYRSRAAPVGVPAAALAQLSPLHVDLILFILLSPFVRSFMSLFLFCNSIFVICTRLRRSRFHGRRQRCLNAQRRCAANGSRQFELLRITLITWSALASIIQKKTRQQHQHQPRTSVTPESEWSIKLILNRRHLETCYTYTVYLLQSICVWCSLLMSMAMAMANAHWLHTGK